VAIKKGRKKGEGVYFVSMKVKGFMKVKTKLRTYKVNNSVNFIKYESTCPRGKPPDTAGDNNIQTIDRSFPSWLPDPLSQQTIWILTWKKIFNINETNSNHDKKLPS